MDADEEKLTDDPEIAALLDFEPVVRKCRRHDGWTPANQRRYIVGLAETGNPEQAAHPLGRTMSGAYKLRSAAGGEGFAAAWDGALALHLRRNPRVLKGRPSRGEILAGSGRAWPARAAPAPAPAPEDPEAAERAKLELFAKILELYRRKVAAERKARLAGRIVEADFYVRQLTMIELALDLGCNVQELIAMLSRGDLTPLQAVATPMSLLLDKHRRDYWREKGEPDRFPLPDLGPHDEYAAYGESGYNQYSAAEDGDHESWLRRRDALAAERAEAQRLWEEKAATEAEAWRNRVEGEEGEEEGGGEGEGEEGRDGEEAEGEERQP
ncbi:MAG: hypothetical protein QOD42_3397 [Sphingomonadales bacterium]|jgi:hypothetical protein|nr:hypothetical protein [Sphingomonadales bacterium]